MQKANFTVCCLLTCRYKPVCKCKLCFIEARNHCQWRTCIEQSTERFFPYLVGYPFSSILIHIVSCRIEGSLDYLSLRKPTNLKKERKWTVSTLLVDCTHNFFIWTIRNWQTPEQPLTQKYKWITQESLTYRPNWPISDIRDVLSSLPYLLHPLPPQPLSHSALPGLSVPPGLGREEAVLGHWRSTSGMHNGGLQTVVQDLQHHNCLETRTKLRPADKETRARAQQSVSKQFSHLLLTTLCTRDADTHKLVWVFNINEFIRHSTETKYLWSFLQIIS